MLKGDAYALLCRIQPASEGSSFRVLRTALPGVVYVGRDGQAHAAFLIRTTGSDSFVPLRLAGLEASFCVPCAVSENDSARTEVLSTITCLSDDRAVEEMFVTTVESFLRLLPPVPPVSAFRAGVDRLIDLFQKLRRPAQRSVIGFLGELCVIRAAQSTRHAVEAWRSAPQESFDFVAGCLRLDAKASSQSDGFHTVSYEQVNPPSGTRGIFATVVVRLASGGTSLREMMMLIHSRMGDATLSMKLWDVAATTLGDSLLTALESRFDLALMDSSLQFYDAEAIPAIRPPLPRGVSKVRFESDFAGVPPVCLNDLRGTFSDIELSILPK